MWARRPRQNLAASRLALGSLRVARSTPGLMVRAGRKALEVASRTGLPRPLRSPRTLLVLRPINLSWCVGVNCSIHLISWQLTRIYLQLALWPSLDDWHFRSPCREYDAAMQSLGARFDQWHVCVAHHACHTLGKQADARMRRMLGRRIDDSVRTALSA